jgi:hypothetical protein
VLIDTWPHKISAIKDITFDALIDNNGFENVLIRNTGIYAREIILFACPIDKKWIVITNIDQHFGSSNFVADDLIVLSEEYFQTLLIELLG